mgnify:CR=1 FL=1
MLFGGISGIMKESFYDGTGGRFLGQVWRTKNDNLLIKIIDRDLSREELR